MADETREEKVKRITDRIHKDRGFVYDVLGFGAELDPDYFEVYCQMHWGFFKEKDRHLDAKTRELIEIGILAFKGMKHEVYTHTKKALRLGATMEEALEAFEVASIGGGAPVLMEGLYALKRIHDEQQAEKEGK
ncbi:MAG: carboxymuconolactone decarboxylase family protein [Nitrospinaceae bacterium]|jgi:AhpD family alkylhydroperoxidase|nr:carboxymuconolactone decarboxylase family protein [Nitrospinaceae bacterium]MBT3435037.1 carboxymuconolactone decarboxylase family protein [Nitrospinaceae bacterium]MBT3822299.1 carboxymuconolactone decarboxylase family protein [Nitrospinaceae bacterium]MBT4095130.1 carboxymuconolactone decarboxylase family protein [Nitrospinaceae bacterium]MBT4431308.1 carboxymuconolactone decarboxylase family protein [Nitrospinaceae bacterium]